MQEIFKPLMFIKDNKWIRAPGYEISNYGNLKSLKLNSLSFLSSTSKYIGSTL